MASKTEDESPHNSIQQGIDKHITNYYDIMVIGKTGVGKSTTADKLLIANPHGEKYLGQPDVDPIRSDIIGCIQHSDMYMWHLSDKEDEIERVSKRLKNLVFYRSLEKPHDEVNASRDDPETYGSTEECELLSNDSTKIRVLDVPGFYGSEACPNTTMNVRDRAVATTNNDLSIMRKILHIKMAKQFKFNRIVYFLPEKGALKRDNQILQTEIGIMEYYFGRSIFESMVVVATYPAETYQFFKKSADLFPEKENERTRHFFQLAMERVFGREDVPQPPIIFISQFDTCEDIFHKIKHSKVSREGVELQFNPFTCARCNIRIGKLKDDKDGDDQKDVLATCTYNDWASAIPYEDSTCHPMMIPKYSRLQKIVGEIAHLITFKLFLGKWPNYKSLEEVCIKCGLTPKTRGCVKVRTIYTFESGTIKVDHTSTVDESYVIKMEEGQEDDELDNTAAIVGTSVLPSASGLIGRYVDIGEQAIPSFRGEGDGHDRGEGDEHDSEKGEEAQEEEGYGP